jgi:hypothetical protein
MSSGTGFKVLPAGAGYGIVIGIGGIFALIMLGITWLQNRYVRVESAPLLRSATDCNQDTIFDQAI